MGGDGGGGGAFDGHLVHPDLPQGTPPSASQKALPKGSLAHAGQLEGSPVHIAGCPGVVYVKTRRPVPAGRRRSGTGGWYGGRFSRSDSGGSTSENESSDDLVSIE